MTIIRLVTYDLDQYNPYQFGGSDPHYSELERKRAVVIQEIIKELQPDILLVQGIVGYDQEQIETTTKLLAAQTGLNCQHGQHITAQKSDHSPYGTGILWSPRMAVLSWRVANHFWHPLGVLSIQINGQVINHLCYQGQPMGHLRKAGGDTRTREAAEVAKLTCINPLSIVGGNWNGLSASRRSPQDGGTYWDAPPQFSQQLGNSEVEFVYNRTPGEMLERRKLRDIAPQMENVQPTTHFRYSPASPYRPDRFYATQQMMRFVRSIEVYTAPPAASVSSHFPVLLTYEIR